MSVLLAASPGGHLVQLSLLAEEFRNEKVIVVSTYEKKPVFISGDCYEQLIDFSRSSCYRFFFCFVKALTIIKKHRPQLLITTGAAPGLVMILAARFYGVKSVWIDSLANSKKLSLSGKLAKKLGVDTLSQWENVAKNAGVRYEGRVV